MKTEYTFSIAGMFKILCYSEKEKDEIVTAVKLSLEQTLFDLEMRGLINSYYKASRKPTDFSRGSMSMFDELKKQLVKVG